MLLFSNYDKDSLIPQSIQRGKEIKKKRNGDKKKNIFSCQFLFTYIFISDLSIKQDFHSSVPEEINSILSNKNRSNEET